MSTVVSVLIVASTLAFGAVYWWGYVPLFVAAGCIGVFGIVRARRLQDEPRALVVGLLLVAAAVAAQLVPLPRTVLDLVSPSASKFLTAYSLTFGSAGTPHSLSIDGAATRISLLGVCGLGLYMLGLPSLLSSRDLQRVARNLLVFAVLLALAGVFGREHNNGLVYGFWQPEEGTNSNGFGPYVNRNHFAGWMLMVTCLSTGVLCGLMETTSFSARPGLRSRVIWWSTDRAARIVLAAAGVGIMAMALVWTMSRSGIVSFTCAVTGFVWLLARRRRLQGARRAAVVATLFFVLAGSLAWRGVSHLGSWFVDPTDLLSRASAWRDGWTLVRDFPLTGSGVNTYGTAMVLYQQHVMNLWMTHAHNDYLQLLAEGGLLVGVPAAVAVVGLVLAVRRRTGEMRGSAREYWVRAGAGMALVAIAIQESVEFSLQMPANAFLFATLAAMAITPPRQSESDHRHVNR